MNKTLALLAILTLAGNAEAKPRVADKKFWVMAGLAVASSIATTQSIHRCRQDHGIGPCIGGGYGEFRARETVRFSLTGGLVVASYFWKRIDSESGTKHSFWWTLPLGAIAVNGGTIARNQLRTFGPPELPRGKCFIGESCVKGPL